MCAAEVSLKNRSQEAAKQQAKRENPSFYTAAVRYSASGEKVSTNPQPTKEKGK